MAYVRLNVDVDIDMSEFETDELVAELDRRCKSPTDEVDHGPALQAMFTALSLGQEDEALKLLRSYLCDCLGRVM